MSFGSSTNFHARAADMLDRVVDLRVNESARAIRQVSMRWDVFRDHFPLRPVVPGVLIADGLVQLAALLLSASADYGCEARLDGMTDVRFRSFVRPGDTLELDVRILRRDGLSALLRGRASVGGKAVCTVREMAMTETVLSGGQRRRLLKQLSNA